MEQTKIDIKTLKDDVSILLDEQATTGTIFVESAKSSVLSQITLSGKYNHTYTVATSYVNLTHERVLVHDKLLVICAIFDLAIIDLEQNTLLQIINLCKYSLFSIHKFKTGYFIHGELLNYFLNHNFEIVWQEGAIDIFSNSKVEKDLEIFEDYIVAWDWYGYKHYYNESGEFKTEHYPQYRMSD